MQHLEVSCAVRRLFKSLGFKGLINVYYITYAQVSTVNLYKITPTCFGVNTASSGSLQLCWLKL